MKTIFGKLIFAAPLLALATNVSAYLPSRTGLVALGCEPNGKAAPVSPSEALFPESPRKRYVFMRRDDDDGIAEFCMDEIDTEKKMPPHVRRALSAISLRYLPNMARPSASRKSPYSAPTRRWCWCESRAGDEPLFVYSSARSRCNFGLCDQSKAHTEIQQCFLVLAGRDFVSQYLISLVPFPDIVSP